MNAETSPINRATCWRIRGRTIDFGRLPVVMGIVNVTPDSFSDGGRYFEPQAAIEHGLRLHGQGARILDIGGESTRPYSQSIDEIEELRRVLPVIRAISEQSDAVISIDTSKAKVAREAVAAGAHVINDVTAVTGDPDMVNAVLETGCGLCAMHMQGTPQSMQDNPTYRNVVAEIFNYLQARVEVLCAAGIPLECICVDPGIGFGKSHDHNLEILARIGRFHSLGVPVLVGHSRKGFIAKCIGDKTIDRDPATLALSIYLAKSGVQIIRVHEVAQTINALKTLDAVRFFN